MATLRDEITNTIRRLGRRTAQKLKQTNPQLDETIVATDARIGRQFGNYRILQRVGAGGMGHVYLALDTRLQRNAALKFLSPKLKSNPEMLARLQQEARTASSLNHPNILTIYDIDEAEGEPFIASEFVEGITLRQALERGPLDPPQILDISIQIASALKPAHEAGIIHRDLKPGNVMLRPDGLVKVIDFGLAKFTAQGHVAPHYEPLSDPESVAGTVQYMSPEQARGDEVDHRTDLWSLGVMLYEMISLRKPFDGETESHVIVAILDHKQADLKASVGLPAGLVRVVEKALAKHPDKRYPAAQEMLSALKALELSSQSSPSRVFAAALAKRRKARWHWFAGLACILLLALAIWWWPLHGREVAMGPDWFIPADFTQVTNRGDVRLAALSPDGTHVAYATTRDGQQQLHSLNLATHETFDWPPYAGTTWGITFSPNSSALFYTVHDQREWGRLYKAGEGSNDQTFVLDDVDGPIAFSPDGSEFAFRRRSEDKRANHEAIVIARTEDTSDQHVILEKSNSGVGTRVAWSANGLMAVNQSKPDLQGEIKATVLLFSRAGKILAEYSNPRISSLSGPAWIDEGFGLVFAGHGKGVDETQPAVIELARHNGEFRSFTSPTLTPNSLTVSRDFKTLAAVSSAHKSALFIAAATNLDAPEQWAGDQSLSSFTWNSDDSIVFSSMRGGSLAFWETKGGRTATLLSNRNDCVNREPAIVPGKKMLVFSSNCDANANSSNLWLLNEADGKSAKLTSNSHSDHQPAVAPDGDTVIYNSWPDNFPSLLKISLRTRVKAQFSQLQARNAAISRDGKSVVCQVRENYDGRWRVAILSMLDGIIEKDNLPLPVEINSIIRWSPDNKSLDYVDERDSTNVWRYSLDRKLAQPLAHWHGEKISDFAWSGDGARLAWVSSDIKQDVLIFHRGGK